MVKTNMGPYCYLTHFLIQKLANRESRSAIIFVSSTAAHFAVPYFSTYSATKIFSDHFSRNLSYEVYEDKIDVLSVKPSAVQTGINTMKPSGLSIISAAECVSGSLDKLGHDIETLGSWKH